MMAALCDVQPLRPDGASPAALPVVTGLAFHFPAFRLHLRVPSPDLQADEGPCSRLGQRTDRDPVIMLPLILAGADGGS
jgi:hypothetical protein